MSERAATLGAVTRLLGVLALLGLVAMHSATSAHATHAGVTAAPAAVIAAAPENGHAAGTGAQPATCPTGHHGQSATVMNCTSAAPSPGPGGEDALAARAASHVLLPAALPQWPSPRSATFSPPAAAPSHVILRT